MTADDGASWERLFDRAEEYDVALATVRTAPARRRTESTAANGEGAEVDDA